MISLDQDWFVVMADVVDGHDKDKYFITRDEDLLHKFYAACWPCDIWISDCMTYVEANRYVRENLEGYIQIDPRGFLAVSEQITSNFMKRE